MKTHNLIAFDIGATSGRCMLGTIDEKGVTIRELSRFANRRVCVHGKYYWDIYGLYNSLVEGLKIASSLNLNIDSIGIDTWGVDFVYVGEDGSLLGLPRSYRDPYTEGVPEKYFEILSKKELYDLTGIQIMNINSLFQLYAAKHEDCSALNVAKQLLFTPDALAYLLTGEMVCEYTIASTSQFINAKTRQVEPCLLQAIGIDSSLVPPIVLPGTEVGQLTQALAKECNLDRIPVIAVAGHDTGSAVVSVPAADKNFAYLSSGTWSLMGIEVPEPIITDESYNINFTNEGGVDGTIRFLKNISGMWLLERCREEWDAKGKKYSYGELATMSNSTEAFRSLIDPDHPSFANPISMTEAIVAYCNSTNQVAPQSDAAFVRCIFDSLALKYKYVFDKLKQMSPFAIHKLHVIGGGSQNRLLNQMIANSLGITVVAGPAEATAIGNIMVQAKGLGIVNSVQEIREIVAKSTTLEEFYPQETEAWQTAYENYRSKIEIKD